jgi:hypothetical protein
MRLGLALSLAKAKEISGAPAGIPISSTQFLSINIAGYESNSGVFAKKALEQVLIDYNSVKLYSKTGNCYVLGGSYGGSVLFSPDAQTTNDLIFGELQIGTPFGTWKVGQIDYDGENDNWFFTERASNPSTNVNFIPQTGWTPTNTTITKFTPTFISRIVITGSSTPNFNGTYNASSVPAYGNEYPDRVDSYGFNGPASLAWNSGEPRFELYANGSGATGGFGSGDGINWGSIEEYIKEIVVSGFEGIYSDANGSYLLDGIGSGIWVNDTQYVIQSGELYSDAAVLLATNSTNYTGSWTPVGYISSITLTGAATTSANGTYTRTDTQIDMANVSFTASGGRSIDRTGGDWIVNPDELYIGDLTDWNPLSVFGGPDAPTGVTGDSPRSIGSVTSSVIYVPSGSISGSITTTAI